MDEPQRVVDAEFTVISGPREPELPPLRWWQGWRLYYDWRAALGVVAMTLPSALAMLLHRH
jgi:hypothetical protein